MCRKEKVAVIGLGYVGLPLACLCSRKGYDTFGIDLDSRKVELINSKKSPFHDPRLDSEVKACSIRASVDISLVSSSDIVIICVPTPVDSKHVPDLNPLKSACSSVAKHMKKGQLIVVESTIFPGTIEEIVQPILEGTDLKAGVDFDLVHCPERIDPGNVTFNVENLPRVIGGLTPLGTSRAAMFYRSIVDAQIMELSSAKAAEATKIVENTFRDVNIAFVNELAKSFDRFGIDITEVIRGASTKPFAFMPHLPSCGVGGHCIPVDPYYLIERAKEVGFEHSFLTLARKINKSMPKYTVGIYTRELNELEMPVKGSKVVVLGLSYKRNVDDMRESPSFEIVRILKERGADVKAYDPYVPEKSDFADLAAALEFADNVVIATDHDEFSSISPSLLAQKGIRLLVDGKNCMDKGSIIAAGIRYIGIGR